MLLKALTAMEQMKTRLFENRKGLVAVIVLILLVVSILLALIAVLYAMSIIGNTPPKELLRVHKYHIWYNSSGWFELGFAVTNNGGTDVFFEKITVQGGLCDWENTYYYKNASVGLSEELNVTRSELPDTQYADLSSVFRYGDGVFTRASSGVTLKSGWTIVLYIKNPPGVYLNQRTPSTLRVYTSTTSYPKELFLETVS